MDATVLAIEPSTRACSIALSYRGRVNTCEMLKESDVILPMIDAIFVENKLTINQIDVLALSRGPGSFTGLRLGAALVQAVSCAHHIPVLLISSLQALAQVAYDRFGYQNILTAVDAQMQQVYWSAFSVDAHNLMTPVFSEQIIKPSEAAVPQSKDWVGVGSGWDRYHATLTQKLGKQVIWVSGISSNAEAVLKLARSQYERKNFVSPEDVLPVYLRDEIVKNTDEVYG